MRPLLYLIVILVSCFLLVSLGVLSGGLLGYSLGSHAALAGALAGLVAGFCLWFRLVGHLVEHEHATCGVPQSNGIAPPSPGEEGGTSLATGDARWGDRMMAGGMATILSGLVGTSGTGRLVVGAVGVVLIAAGLIVSLAAHEFPAEAGAWRRVRLLAAKGRT